MLSWMEDARDERLRRWRSRSIFGDAGMVRYVEGTPRGVDRYKEMAITGWRSMARFSFRYTVACMYTCCTLAEF